MKTTIARLSILAVAFVAVPGCHLFMDPKIDEESKTKQLVQDEPTWRPEQSAAWLREISPEQALKKKKITLVQDDVPLVEAVSKVITGLSVVPTDNVVDIRKRIPVKVQNLSGDAYLRYLEGASGYGLQLKGNVLYASSHLTMSWNLANFASKRTHETEVLTQLGGSTEKGTEGAKSKVVSSSSEDSWEQMLSDARAILGIAGGTAGAAAGAAVPVGMPMGASSEAAEKVGVEKVTYVTGARGVGLVTASGEPRRMRLLDDYFSNVMSASSRQIHIDVRSYDVILNDAKSTGIDWDYMTQVLGGKGSVGGTYNSNTADVLSTAKSAFSSAIGFDDGTTSVTAVASFLSRYGDIELLNQPNITTRNGSTAYFHSGSEFSYVADIEIEKDDTGNVSSAPKFARLKVGITLAVTPRILGDDRILLDVTPVLSEVVGSTDFDVQGFKFETPNIDAQELATQVIVRSGATVQLGGLIRKKLLENTQGVPWRNPVTGAFGKLFFHAEDNSLQRRELVILVTPTLVEGS